MLAARNPASMASSGVMTTTVRGVDHPQLRRATTAIRIVVMNMTLVTAMPYAAASLLDVRKVITNPTPYKVAQQLGLAGGAGMVTAAIQLQPLQRYLSLVLLLAKSRMLVVELPLLTKRQPFNLCQLLQLQSMITKPLPQAPLFQCLLS